MKQIRLRYRLIVLALIGTGLLLITLSAFCFGQRAKDKKGPAGDESGQQLIPISKLQIPVELAKKAEMKSQAFLKFFKTPTQQFMPLGFLSMVHDIRDLEKLKALRRRGINLVHRYFGRQPAEHALEDLRCAQEAGIAVLQNLPSYFFPTEGREFWQQHISALAGNEQILVWYLPEETKTEDIHKLEQLGNIIRATDDKKRPLITYVVNWQPEYLKKMGSILDAVAFGFYPNLSGTRPRIEIKRRIEHAYESGVPVVIATLEAFEGKAGWPRPKDARFDAYLALISGARGILWHGYRYVKQNPELLEAILKVATELNGPDRLGEVLLLGKKLEKLSCKTVKGPNYWHDDYIYGTTTKKPTKIHSIQWTAREYGTYLYIFAVNAAQKTIRPFVVDPNINGGPEYKVTASFGPINSPSSEVRVISEGRIVELSDGYFVDSFELLGTHIYKVKVD